METENFVAFDPQAKSLSTLRAMRIASTVLLVLCGVSGWQQYRAVQTGAEILDSKVTGGLPQLPALTQLAVEHGMAVTALAGLGVFSALVFIWTAARSLSRVILATTISAGISVFVGLVLNFAIASPLRTVLTKFSG